MPVAQTQKHDSLTGTFKVPIDIEFTLPNGQTKLETVRMQDSAQSFIFAVPQKPVMTGPKRSSQREPLENPLGNTPNHQHDWVPEPG